MAGFLMPIDLNSPSTEISGVFWAGNAPAEAKNSATAAIENNRTLCLIIKRPPNDSRA
jgi:hypothetical protein